MPDSNDLKLAFEALTAKAAPYTTLFRYAEGDQPLVYSTDRLREAFDNINARFSQNWCSVVIDALADRLVLKGWDAGSEGANGALDAIWNAQHLGLEAADAHWAALVTNEAFVIVWPDAAGVPQAYYNDPRLCAMFYQPDNPRQKRMAAKWFKGSDERWNLTLYYPDRLEYYLSGGKDVPSAYTGFVLQGEAAVNPYGLIPVFHLRVNRRANSGELANILTLQDAVNKLLADMMVAAEFGAFKQRWIIASGDTDALKNAPNEIWTIPPGDGVGQSTQVGQFDATDLNVYLNAIDKLALSIAIISRTPKHYFFTQGGDPSGEALIAMEAPLNKKAKKRQEAFTAVWQEVGAFLLKLQGQTVEESAIKPVWERVESNQPKTEAETRDIAVRNIPLLTQLRREGWSEADIKQMQKDQQEEADAEYQNVPADWREETQGTGETAAANGRAANPGRPGNAN
jgi:hypothetical protein